MHVMNIHLHFDLIFMLLYFHLYSNATLLSLRATSVVQTGCVAQCAPTGVVVFHVCNAIASFVTLNIIHFCSLVFNVCLMPFMVYYNAMNT